MPLPTCSKSTARRTCDQCQLLVINGIVCHEAGCPDSWKHTTRECAWCGSKFTPEHRNDKTCGTDCRESYYG